MWPVMCVMDGSDTYLGISSPSEGLYKEKGSRFMAFAYPVVSEEEVRPLIEKLRKEYHDARHYCYAYRIGRCGEKWRCSDDGEPSSSAGRPIYGQILSSGLSDILIVVVRYFGGIKLGVPGLIRAYRTAAAEAISCAVKVEKTAAERFRVTFGYQAMDKVMKALKEMGLTPSGMESGEECALEVSVRLALSGTFCGRMESAGASVTRDDR